MRLLRFLYLSLRDCWRARRRKKRPDLSIVAPPTAPGCECPACTGWQRTFR